MLFFNKLNVRIVMFLLFSATHPNALLASEPLPVGGGDRGEERAQAPQTYRFDIPPQALAPAINAFSSVTGFQVGYAADVARGIKDRKSVV